MVCHFRMRRSLSGCRGLCLCEACAHVYVLTPQCVHLRITNFKDALVLRPQIFPDMQGEVAYEYCEVCNNSVAGCTD